MSNMVVWSPGITLEYVEQQVIEKALQHYNGNQSATAVSLGITARTLYAKLNQYRISQSLESEAAEERRKKNEEFLKRCRGETASEEVPVVETEELTVDTIAKMGVSPPAPPEAPSLNRRARG